MSNPVCVYQDVCSGCQLLDLTYEEQKAKKLQDLKTLFLKHQILSPEPAWLSAGSFYLRDRLDFSWNEGRLGLFSKDKSKIVDIEKCLQLSPLLQAWLEQFRQIRWPLQKASFRLRIGPQGQKGVWIDAANVDIKKILEEKKILSDLTKMAFVEIGQRRKNPVLVNHEWKLKSPEFHPWFQTWMADQPVDLFCQVASFTQPSLAANRLISQQLRNWMLEIGRHHILEFGSGIGNLSFPMLEFALSYTACEIDSLAVEGFRQSLKTQKTKIQVDLLEGDFQKNKNLDFSRFSLALCNPPRSGLKDFVLPIIEDSQKAPEFFIYMSCFPESLSVDLERLQKIGYQIKKTTILDQFPQTDHYEVLTLLQRKK